MIYDKKVENEKDFDNAISIRRKVFVEEQDIPIHLELDEFDETSIHFIAYDADIPFGAGRIREIDGKVGKIERVCIVPSYRGKSMGNLIMQSIEDYAQEHGFKKLKLNAQSNSLPFYEKGNYTNEWNGQSNSGKDLPTGTYFYQIQNRNGEKFTGYIQLTF